jgi:hypothetical protein
MLRRLGRALGEGIPIVCLAGALLAVPLGYLGMLLNHDGLVTLAACLALPFILLLSILFAPALLYIPLFLLAGLWLAIKEWLLPRVLRRGAGAGRGGSGFA